MVRRFRGVVRVGAVVAVLAVTVSIGVVVGGGLPAGAATTAASDPLGGTTSTSLDVRLNCGGTPTSIPITLTVPKLVRAHGAFSLSATNAETDDLQLALTNANSGAVDVPSGDTPKTTQVVANGKPGQVISINVTGAVQLVPFTFMDITLYNEVQCTPMAPTTLASIRIISGSSSPTVAHVNFGAAWECDLDGVIGGVGNEGQSFDVPTKVAHGSTFSLPGISSPDGLAGSPYLFAAADGATVTPEGFFGEIGPDSVLTVTAPPGGVVTIRQRAISTASIIGAHCGTIGSGVLATIPVT